MSINGNHQLPPGLLTRQGTPLKPNQRLPSLKNSTTLLLNSPNILPNVAGNQNLTKGGAVKRQFKPKIPLPKNEKADTNSTATSAEQTKKQTNSVSSNKKERVPFNRKKKELIQLEGTVFKGAINAASAQRSAADKFSSSTYPANSSRETVTRSFGDRKSNSAADIKTESKTRVKQEILDTSGVDGDLYRDNFIAYSDEDDDENGVDDGDDLRPIGIEYLTTINNNKCSTVKIEDKKNLSSASSTAATSATNAAITPSIICDLLLNKDKSEEKLLLFQLPETLINKSNGLIGKLRFFRSGKIELIDNDANFKYDLINSQSTSTLKQENKFSTSNNKLTNNNSNSNSIEFNKNKKELVSIAGNKLHSLGSLYTNDVLIAVPQMPDTLEPYINCD